MFDNKILDGQLSLFDLTTPIFKIHNPIRLIELFAGVGSQAMALRDLGADFEHYRVVEFDKSGKAISIEEKPENVELIKLLKNFFFRLQKKIQYATIYII